MLRPGQQPIVWILLAQVLVSGLVAAGLALWLGRTVGISAVLGGAVAVLPNAFLAARLLAPGHEASAAVLLQSAWLGEIGKLIMTVVLFTAVFLAVKPLSVPAVFGGFIAAQLVIFCIPLMGNGWLDGKGVKAKT